MRANPSAPDLLPVYFQLSGLVSGSYVLAGLLATLGGAGVPAAVYPVFLATPVMLALSVGLLSTLVTRPERFRLVLGRFKSSSPASVGAWALVVLAVVSVLTALTVVVAGTTRSLAPSRAFRLLVFLGGAVALVLAAYTGVMLTASSRPVWRKGRLLGGVFCVSSLAAGAAWMRLLMAAGLGPQAGAGVAALRLETLALRLALLAVLAWLFLDQQLAGESAYRPVRSRVYLGLLVGFLLPAALLKAGGGAALAGALLLLVGGVAPRASVVAAGRA